MCAVPRCAAGCDSDCLCQSVCALGLLCENSLKIPADGSVSFRPFRFCDRFRATRRALAVPPAPRKSQPIALSTMSATKTLEQIRADPNVCFVITRSVRILERRTLRTELDFSHPILSLHMPAFNCGADNVYCVCVCSLFLLIEPRNRRTKMLSCTRPSITMEPLMPTAPLTVRFKTNCRGCECFRKFFRTRARLAVSFPFILPLSIYIYI